MGFNKRFVTEKLVKEYFENGIPLKNLFSADAFIFIDDFSSKVYKLYSEGLKDTEIKKQILESYDGKGN